MPEAKEDFFDHYREIKAKYDKYNKQFFKIFRQILSKYWNIHHGFDVIKFDEKLLKTPDGTSTFEQVEKMFGAEGLNLVNDLLARR